MNPIIAPCRPLRTTVTPFMVATCPLAVRPLATDIIAATAGGIHRISAMACHTLTRLICAAVVLCSLSASASAENLQTAERVTLQLKWTHAFQFAGYYAALEKGYYRDAGLDVKIVEATPGVDPIKSVIEDQAQFGVGTSSLLLERKAGKPVVALAVIFQHSPYVLIARADNATQGIHDLVGKRIMLEPQSDEILAYLRAEGIPLERVTRVEHSYDPQDLIAGRVDAIAGYVTNQPYYLDHARFPYQIYTPRSAGIDFYGDNLFTTEQEVRTHPARVQAFRAASLRGWQYAMQHPEEIVDLIVAKYSQRHTRDYFLFEARQMVPLLRPELIEVGYMYPGRWRHIAEVYADLGMMDRGFDLKGFLYDPNPPPPNLRWLYALIGVAMLVIAAVATLAIYIHRINTRLRQEAAERKQAQTALTERESRHRILFENAPIGVFYSTADGKIIGVNPAYARMMGYASPEEMKEVVNRSSVAEALYPQREERSEMVRRVQELEGGWIRVDRRYRRKDGSIVLANLVFRALPGSPDELEGFVEDITERKQAEEALRESEAKYRVLTESMKDVVWTLDADTLRFLYVSPSVQRLRGFTPEEIIAQPALDALTPQGADYVRRVIRQRAEDCRVGNTPPDRFYTNEVEQPCKDGTTVWTEVISNYHLNPGTGHVEVRAVTRDITERKRAEAALRAAKAAAEAATQVKEQFLAKLSHELRTPLTPVLLVASQWQAQADLPPAWRDDLAMVRRNLELEARLLDDLLDANRILYGKLSLRRTVVGVHQAIGQCQGIVAASVRAKGLRLTVQLDATNDRVDGDPARIQQILWNLLTNAIKFTPEGGSIAVCTANDPAGQIRVQITDSGLGIERDLLSRLFNAFEQGDQQINREYGGMGLGLSICKSMTEAHGGSIVVSSEGKGQGATFTVQLPLTHAAVPVEPAVPSPVHAVPAGIGPLRILLVEDNADTARIMSRLLRANGYAVETAGDVASALNCVRQSRFDLLVSDLGLPDGSGHDLMRQLVASGRLIKAIAVSGYGTEDDIHKSLEVGFVDHLVKPINLPQLLSTIQRVVGARTAEVTGSVTHDIAPAKQ